MRWTAILLAISLLSLMWGPAICGEEPRNGSAASGQSQFGVLCRWIESDGEVVMTPKLTLSADQKGIASNTQPSVFVIGLTPEGKAQRPHINHGAGRSDD